MQASNNNKSPQINKPNTTNQADGQGKGNAFSLPLAPRPTAVRPEPLSWTSAQRKGSQNDDSEGREGYESAERTGIASGAKMSSVTGLPTIQFQCHTPLVAPSSPFDLRGSTASVQYQRQQLSSQNGIQLGVTNRRTATASFDDIGAAANHLGSPFVNTGFVNLATPAGAHGVISGGFHSRTPSAFDTTSYISGVVPQPPQTPVIAKRRFYSFPREQWQLRLWTFCCFILCCSLGETRQSLAQKWSRSTRLRITATRIARVIAAIFIISLMHTHRRLFLSLPLQLAGQCPFGAVLERSDMGKLYTAAGSTANAQNSAKRGGGPAAPKEVSDSSASKSLNKFPSEQKEERKDEIPLHQLRKLQNNGVQLASMDELVLPHLRMVPVGRQRSSGKSEPLPSQWSKAIFDDQGQGGQKVALEMDLAENLKHHAMPFPMLMRRVSYTIDSNGHLEIDKLISRGGWSQWSSNNESRSAEGSDTSFLGHNPPEFYLDLKTADPETAAPYIEDERKLLAYLQHRERALWWRNVKTHHKDMDTGKDADKTKADSDAQKNNDPLKRYTFESLFDPQHILSQGIWRRHHSVRYQSRMNFEFVDATGVPIFEKYLRNADEKFFIQNDVVDVKRVTLSPHDLRPDSSTSRGTVLSIRKALVQQGNIPYNSLKLGTFKDLSSVVGSEPVSAVRVTWGGKPFHDEARDLNLRSASLSIFRDVSHQEEVPGLDESTPTKMSGNWLARLWADLGKTMRNFHGVRFHVRSDADEKDMLRADASIGGEAATAAQRHSRAVAGVLEGANIERKSLPPIPNMGLVEYIGTKANRLTNGAVGEGEILSDDELRNGNLNNPASSEQLEISRKKVNYLKHLARSSYVIPIQERKVPLVIVQTNQNMVVPSGMRDATERLLKDNPEFSYEYFSDADMDNFVALYFGDSHDTEDEEELGPEDSSLRKERLQRAKALADEFNILIPAKMRDQGKATVGEERKKKHHPIAQAYFSLIPGAYRADLFRYLYLYLFGGVYIDMGMSPPSSASYSPFSDYKEICNRHKENAQLQKNWAKVHFGLDDKLGQTSSARARYRDKKQLLKTPQSFCPGPLFSLLRPEDTFISAEDSLEGLVYNAFMMAAPAHPILRTAIVMSVNKILAKYWVVQTKHNNAALSVTGPKLLAEAFREVTKRSPEPNVNYGKGIRLVSYWRYNACLSGAIESEVDVRAELMIYENRDLLEYDRRSGKAGGRVKDDGSSTPHTDLFVRATVPDDMQPDVQRTRTLLFTKYESYYHDSRFYHLFPHYGILYGAKKIYREGDSRKH